MYGACKDWDSVKWVSWLVEKCVLSMTSRTRGWRTVLGGLGVFEGVSASSTIHLFTSSTGNLYQDHPFFKDLPVLSGEE